MKKIALVAALVGATFCAVPAIAQEAQEVAVSLDQPCKTHYYSTSRDNWFIQIGAGIQSPFVENYLPRTDAKHKITAAYNLGFGKWFSPYLGWRISFLGGAMRWDNGEISKAKNVNANLDFMWDMFNSIGGVNPNRTFSIVPFVGLGGTYVWDIKAPASNIYNENDVIKDESWTLPVSAGLQLRFRLCKYVDLFFEGRAQFYGDNFNGCAYGQPVDVNISAIGGLTFNLGGSQFRTFNPCDYTDYINSLNGQVNDLRSALAATAADLAAAQAQLPCPEVKEQQPVVTTAPLLASVRFKIGSAVITSTEEVNVYNIAEWLKANPEQKVVIAGYADKKTGSADFNKKLSEKRAQAVCDMLVNEYGIASDRLTTKSFGSDEQVYTGKGQNDWNRIVIFKAN